MLNYAPDGMAFGGVALAEPDWAAGLRGSALFSTLFDRPAKPAPRAGFSWKGVGGPAHGGFQPERMSGLCASG